MGRQSKSAREVGIHQAAITQFDTIQSAMRDIRLQCLADRRFCSIAGAQWEGPLTDQFENKPKMEVNKIHAAVIRIINEYRNNRIDVVFTSKDGGSNEQLTDTCSMLYRADEQDSVAEEAYDNAFDEAVQGGFGAWRLKTCYEDEYDEEDDRQRIRMEPIVDADSCVFFDLNAKRQDKSDAKHCYVLTAMSRESYEETYNDDPASWPKSVHMSEFDWLTPDVVYVCEYYVVEQNSETLITFKGLTGEERKHYEYELEQDDELEEVLLATGFREEKRKKVKSRQIHKYIMSGGSILEDCGIIAGKCIPIVPVYGKRWFVDNVERCMGQVRLVKDVQRLQNMQLSKLAEYSAYSALEKPIFTPEQVAGHESMWADDNIKNWPYMLANPLEDANGQMLAIGPQSYTRAPQVPPAMAALFQVSGQYMQELLGSQQGSPGEDMKSNISGRAVELIQNRMDMQSFIYISNFSKAIKRSGEIWLSMAREILVENGRKMKGINAEGKNEQIELVRPMVSEEGAMYYENDLSEADFDVNVEVGPSSSSKKQSTIRSLTEMMQITQDPETLQVLGSMAMMNMEGEGISEVREFFRKKLIRMGVVKPNKEEGAELQQELENQPPDPNAEFLKASAIQAQASAQKDMASAAKYEADTALSKAKTVETLSKVEIESDNHALKMMADSIPPGQTEQTPGMTTMIEPGA